MMFGTIGHLFEWQNLVMIRLFNKESEVHSNKEVMTEYMLNDLIIPNTIIHKKITGIHPEFILSDVDMDISEYGISQLIPALMISWVGLCIGLNINPKQMKAQIEENINKPDKNGWEGFEPVPRSGKEVAQLIHNQRRRIMYFNPTRFTFNDVDYLMHTANYIIYHAAGVRKEISGTNDASIIMYSAAGIFQGIASMCEYAKINNDDIVKMIRHEWEIQSDHYKQPLFPW